MKNQPRKLEIQRSHGRDWIRYDVRRFAADGQVEVVRADGVEETELLDLSEQRYRWVM